MSENEKDKISLPKKKSSYDELLEHRTTIKGRENGFP